MTFNFLQVKRDTKLVEFRDHETQYQDMLKLLQGLPEYRDEKQVQQLTSKLDYLEGLASSVRTTLKVKQLKRMLLGFLC